MTEECAPRPLQASIIVWNADRSEQVLQFTTDEQGQFRVPLAAGDYYVDPHGSGSPFPVPPNPFPVTVSQNNYVQLEINYDTGIR